MLLSYTKSSISLFNNWSVVIDNMQYFTYRYSLSSHDDYRYDFLYNIEEEKLITYLPVLAYLWLS